MKKVLIILLILSITIVAYAAFTGAGVRFARPLHPQVNTVGLMAHYKMWDGLMAAGAIFDYTCTGKDGTLVDTDGPLITLIPTYPGFNFDGGNDYISIDDHDDFTPGGNNLVGGGDFATGDWVGDNPDPTYWTVEDEVGTDPEVSEVDAGQGHGGTNITGGYCNLYTTTNALHIKQTIAGLIIGRKYRLSINIDTLTSGTLWVYDTFFATVNDMFEGQPYTEPISFVALRTSLDLGIRNGILPTDITFDDVSITPVKPFSISAWVYMHDATNFHIISKGVYNTDGEWRMFTGADSQLRVALIDEDVDDCQIGRRYLTALPENQWLHILWTYNGGTLHSDNKIYLNGIQVDNTTFNSNPGSFNSIKNLNHDVWIGRYSAANYANGLIDDMMFFSKELTAIEVKNIYEVTRWRYSR